MWAFKRQAPHLPNPSLHGCGNGRSCVIICTRALQDTLPITLKQQVQRYSDLRFHKNAQWSQAGGAQKSQQLAAGLVYQSCHKIAPEALSPRTHMTNLQLANEGTFLHSLPAELELGSCFGLASAKRSTRPSEGATPSSFIRRMPPWVFWTG